MGIFLIVLSVFIFLIYFFTDASSAVQQIVQYIGYLCSSVFLSAGLIIIKLNEIIQGKENKKEITGSVSDIKTNDNNKNIKITEKQESSPVFMVIFALVIGVIIITVIFKFFIRANCKTIFVKKYRMSTSEKLSHKVRIFC